MLVALREEGLGRAAQTAPNGRGASGVADDGYPAMLRDRALLSDDALHRALLIHRETGERLDAVVTRLGMISEDRLAAEAADHAGLPLIGAMDFPRAPVGDVDLSPAFLRDSRVLPVAVSEDHVRVAVCDPFDPFVMSAFAFLFRRRVERVVARSTDIDAAI